MLNAVVVGADVALCYTQERQHLLDNLLSEVRQVFPEVSYELDARSRSANAQALARGGKRVVRLYGGLVLHPAISEDALVFVLLHETGHLFAKGRRFAGDPMLACDCAADKWALTSGATLWFQAFGRRFDIIRAMDDLSTAIASTHGLSMRKIAPRPQKSIPKCWAADWQVRKSRLCRGEYFVVGRHCHISP